MISKTILYCSSRMTKESECNWCKIGIHTKVQQDEVFVENKSKIIAKGYSQIQEVDFKKTYAIAACLESFQLLLAIIASLHLYLQQLDFVAAYFNNNIDFNVYMKQSHRFAERKGDMV